MSQRNKSFESHEDFDMNRDNATSWFNCSEVSTVKGSQDDHHSIPGTASDVELTEYYVSDFVYMLHDFEEKIYIYVWVFLVCLTTFSNLLIVAVFIRKRARTSTNILLIFIAISDSLTGLVTLPTYIYVFLSGQEGLVILNESWCESFMISKFYVSSVFHTISIWQTLLLGFQRFFCVWFPFKIKSWFTIRRTLVSVSLITMCAFVFHVYHLSKKKADKMSSFCYWDIEHPCLESCAFIWLSLLLLNILPCFILIVLSILMTQKLFHGHVLQRSKGSQLIIDQQNRNVTIIVVCIIIIFLITEIPYGIFNVLTLVARYSDQEILTFRTNRLFQVIYEITLISSFHANFWVYFILKRQFRDDLKSMFLGFIRKLLPKSSTVNIISVSTRLSKSETNRISGTDEEECSTFL